MWKSIAHVNAKCPRFLIVYPRHVLGLGDILSRLLGGVAAAYITETTLVLEEVVWNKGNHHEKEGYDISIFQDILGIPIGRFLLKDAVMKKYNLTEGAKIPADRILLGADALKASMPCNSIFRLTSGSGCKIPNRWCQLAIGSTQQGMLRPFLDESVRSQTITHATLQPPLLKNKLNVVWHIRAEPGGICLHCSAVGTKVAEDQQFFQRIHAFIADAVKLHAGLEYQNIFVHLEDPRVSTVLQDIPYALHYTNASDVAAVVKLFLQADVLITTGSSFPNLVSYFTPLFKPVVIQALDKDADPAYTLYTPKQLDAIIDSYSIIEGRAFRLDKDGNVMHYQSDDLSFRLQLNGALKRIGVNDTITNIA